MLKNFIVVIFCFLLPCVSASADLFMVKTSEGPGFKSPDEAVEVLEKGILPMFDALLALKKEKRIVAGGLPTGSRTLVMIVEADSQNEVDRMLRDLPGWGAFSWKVTPLQSFEGRAAIERDVVRQLKN